MSSDERARIDAAEDAPVDGAASGDAQRALRVALWSDGKLVIEGKFDTPIVFDVDETRVLLHHLDRLADGAFA